MLEFVHETQHILGLDPLHAPSLTSDFGFSYSRSREDSILLQLVILLYGEGIVAGFERTLDELRRGRGCTLAGQRLR
jgi:hypothetical protein